MRWSGLIFLVVLFSAMGFQIVMLLRASRHARRMDTVIDRVDDFLATWAIHWGEPTDVVREHLMQIVNQRGQEQ